MTKIGSIVAAVLLVFGIHANAFNDLQDVDSVKVNSIDRLTELDLIHGYPDGSFMPNNIVTRAEMTHILAKILFAGDSADNIYVYATYPDVPHDHWAFASIEQMSKLFMINGYEDGTFKPNNGVTYGEAIKIIVNMLNYEHEAEENGGYPNGYIAVAESIGLTKNLDYEPDKSATRADIAVMVNNSLDIPHMIITSYTMNGDIECVVNDRLTFYNLITYN